MATTQIAVVDLRTGESKRLIRGSHPQHMSTGHLVYSVAGTLRAIGFDLKKRETRGQSALVLDGVAATRVGIAQAAVSANGSLVYIPGRGGARRTIVSLDRSGNARPLPNLPSDIYRQVRVSPDGSRQRLDDVVAPVQPVRPVGAGAVDVRARRPQRAA